MKSFYAILLLLIPSILNAQDDLNRTWFLSELTVDGNAITIPNEEGQDGYPTLSIFLDDTNNQVEGIGICNSFLSDNTTGAISATDTTITFNASHTLVFCNTDEEIDFETAYFNFLGAPEPHTFSYVITYGESLESAELSLTNSNGDIAIYNAINPYPPTNLTQEPWYLDYFEIDGIAQNYPAQQAGQLNNYSISYFGPGAGLGQEYICFYGGGGVYSAFNYFGTSTILTSYFALLAMDCGIEELNAYDAAFTSQLENKAFTYEIIEEGQGRRLILTDIHGDRIFYTNAFLSTEEVEQNVTIGLFPNPSSSTITVSGEVDHIQSYQIINLQGRTVTQDTFNTTINIETLATGIYFLKLQGIQTKTIHRFIKNND